MNTQITEIHRPLQGSLLKPAYESAGGDLFIYQNTDDFSENVLSQNLLKNLDASRIESILQKNERQIINKITSDLDFIKISRSMEMNNSKSSDIDAWIKAVEEVNSEKSILRTEHNF